MHWYPNLTTTLRQTQVLTQPDRETTPGDPPALALRVAALRMSHAMMVSSILSSLIGVQEVDPQMIHLVNLPDTTDQIQILPRRVEGETLGIIFQVAGMKISIDP
jgi:hypothetical protein